MGKVFVIDVALCNGCHCCQVACKDEHCGNDWMPYARPQPEAGQFWFKLNEYERGTVGQGLPGQSQVRMSSKVKAAVAPNMCMHCDDAPCIPACPNEAIVKRDDGLVWLDPAKCTGLQLCIPACPYGVIYFNQTLQLSQKCTGCAHLLDRGWPITEPRCVDACITGMMRFGEEADFSAEIAQAEVMLPEENTQPRVYYLNLPKRFIGGTVYDPATKEVAIGATCTLSGDGSGTATTDGFGDFWFEGLAVGTFSLAIAAGGKTATIDAISTEKDVNLGDIALS
ncbi:4Fe-4S dicluster domain-containing protein [Chloroflexota bacterium]